MALEQWLLADRPRDVLRLLSANHGPLYDSGQEATVKRMIAAIPTSVAVSELEAMVDLRLVPPAGQPPSVRRARRTADLVGGAVEPEQHAPGPGGRAPGLGGCRQRALGRERRAEPAGDAQLGESCWQDPLGRFAANGIGREVALSERWDDNSDEVREADSREPRSGTSFGVRGDPSLGRGAGGRPLDALRVAAGVRRAAAVTDMTILRTELAVAEALAYRELGDRSRALAELGALVEAPAETMLFCRVLAMCELAEAHLDGGDLDRHGRSSAGRRPSSRPSRSDPAFATG